MSPDPVDRRWQQTVGAGAAIVVGLLLLVIGFSMDGGKAVPRAVSVSVTTTPLPPVGGPFAAGRTALPGFGEVAIRVTMSDGSVRTYCVMTARTSAQQQRGLMTVTDTKLGGYDGMLFEFPVNGTGGFWMRNTPMPLSIAYLRADGSLVQALDMEPCSDSPGCRTYRPGGEYRMALEVPQGRLPDLGITEGAQVTRGGACPAKT